MLRSIHHHPSNENVCNARRKGSGVAKATSGSFQRSSVYVLVGPRRGGTIAAQSLRCDGIGVASATPHRRALRLHDADAADDGVYCVTSVRK